MERFEDAWRRRIDIEGIPVCHPDDIIASKAAANRVKIASPFRAFAPSASIGWPIDDAAPRKAAAADPLSPALSPLRAREHRTVCGRIAAGSRAPVFPVHAHSGPVTIGTAAASVEFQLA